VGVGTIPCGTGSGVKANHQEEMQLQDEDGFARLQASSSVYRFLTGPNKGKKALVLKTVDQDHSSTQGLVVKASGFSLHAGVSCKAEERKKLERLCRYIATCISEKHTQSAKSDIRYFRGEKWRTSG
jgi:hypothetical protein